jgi:UDP-glucose 4-epimerase
MKTVLLTGSQGFIGSYIAQELLSKGYRVIGIDNFSKYGHVVRPQDSNSNFRLIEMDLSKDKISIDEKVDYVIAGAAMIGGISYFHKYAYDLLAVNERILANTFDYCIENKIPIMVLSSSMVYENENSWPSREDKLAQLPAPNSSYGFQKLSSEYFAKSAWEQYQLPYTIIRPFNCVGVGEDKALGEEQVKSGNIDLMMSHVLPDLVNKIIKGQNPVHILGDGSQVRCYTNGKDIARGIRMAMESPAAVNNSYNISTSRETTVKELLQIVWSKLKPGEDYTVVSDEPYHYDVKYRLPDTTKALEDFGFESEVSLEDSVDEVIQWMVENGK